MLEVQEVLYNACLVAGMSLQFALTWLLVVCCYALMVLVAAAVLKVILKIVVEGFLRLSYRFMLTISKAKRNSNA